MYPVLKIMHMLNFLNTTRNVAFCQGQKPWQNAKSLGNWTFARGFARSRIPSKSAHRKWICKGFSSWQMRPCHRPWHDPWQTVSVKMQAFLVNAGFCRLCVSITTVLFKTCQGLCEGLTPGKLRTIFFLKMFFIF